MLTRGSWNRGTGHRETLQRGARSNKGVGAEYRPSRRQI